MFKDKSIKKLQQTNTRVLRKLFHIIKCTCRVVKRRFVGMGISRGNPLNDPLWSLWRRRPVISQSSISCNVPRIEVNHSVIHPRTVRQAQVFFGQSHNPIRTRNHLMNNFLCVSNSFALFECIFDYFRDDREQVMNSVDAKDCECLPHHVGSLLEALSFYHRPDVVAKPLHFALEPPGHPSLSKNLQRWRCGSSILPKPII